MFNKKFCILSESIMVFLLDAMETQLEIDYQRFQSLSTIGGVLTIYYKPVDEEDPGYYDVMTRAEMLLKTPDEVYEILDQAIAKFEEEGAF